MKSDEMYIKWLELTANLIKKYNLGNISIKIESHLMGPDIDKAMYKELLKLIIKDENGFLIEKEYYDILKGKEVE